MRIDVAFTGRDFNSQDSTGKRIVVVDVLRASTSIVTALAHGARKVIPVETPEKAKETAKAMPKNTALLCGERESVRLPGFDLGNSPEEYKEDIVRDKVLIFTSTNGSRTLLKAQAADEVFMGGFVNMSALIRRLIADDKDSLIACSGHNGGFCLEDGVCAGMIVDRLKKEMPQDAIDMGDEGLAGYVLYQYYDNKLHKMMEESFWGKQLIDNGMGDDLPICVSIDLYDVVPVLRGGALVHDKNW